LGIIPSHLFACATDKNTSTDRSVEYVVGRVTTFTRGSETVSGSDNADVGPEYGD
jgi:hypothetical protein